MKIHKMNKEVHHDGTVYKKGQKVSEDSQHFDVLKKGGHIETQDVAKEIEEQKEADSKSEEKSEQPAESKGKSKK